MKIILTIAALFLVFGSAVAVSQTRVPSDVDGRQYALMPYVLDASRQSYEKVCGPFYWSEVLGSGNELVGFRFSRDGRIERPLVRLQNLSVQVDATAVSVTVQEVSSEDSGHYIFRMGQHDYDAVKDTCLSGVARMK